MCNMALCVCRTERNPKQKYETKTKKSTNLGFNHSISSQRQALYVQLPALEVCPMHRLSYS